MSLFICENCGCVENTNLVHKNEGTNPAAPNMWLMDMQGHGGIIDISMLSITEKINGEMYKKTIKQENEILMICSECNTGIWHGEFDKKIATDDEKEMAAYSKYNMITPYDHPDNVIVKDNDAPHGYKLKDRKESHV